MELIGASVSWRRSLARVGLQQPASSGLARRPTAGLEDAGGVIEKMKEAEPMHRVAEPEEMVGMVLFLCSKAAW